RIPVRLDRQGLEENAAEVSVEAGQFGLAGAGNARENGQGRPLGGLERCVEGVEYPWVETQAVVAARIADTREPGQLVNLRLHRQPGPIHGEMRSFDFLVPRLYLGRAFVGGTETVEFDLCLVCGAFEDRGLLH